MKLYIVKSYANILDVYGKKSDANRRVAVENRIAKDNSKLESQLVSIRFYIENSKNCPIKKKNKEVKGGSRRYIYLDMSAFVDVLDYKDCVKQTHVGYCKRFNKEQRPLYRSMVEIVETELK